MKQDVWFICRVSLGEEKQAVLQSEADERGISLGDWVKSLMEDNAHLILGEGMGE